MVLRRMAISDVDYLMGIFSDPVTMHYYPATKTRTEAEEWVRWTLGSYRDHGFGLWVAVLKKSGEFAGQCGLTVQEVEGKKRWRSATSSCGGTGAGDSPPRPQGRQGSRLRARLPASDLPHRSSKTSPPVASPKESASRWRRRFGSGTRKCASTQRAMAVSSTSQTDACLYPSELCSRRSLPLRHRSSRSLISASSPLLFGS